MVLLAIATGGSLIVAILGVLWFVERARRQVYTELAMQMRDQRAQWMLMYETAIDAIKATDIVQKTQAEALRKTTDVRLQYARDVAAKEAKQTSTQPKTVKLDDGKVVKLDELEILG